MSFSLSNLLNPSPEAEPQHDHSPTDQRKGSLPSIHSLHSPEQQHAKIPQYAPPSRQQRSSQSDGQEAQALTAFASSNAPPPTTWNGYTAADGGEARPGSGHSHGMELPPPPPVDAAHRKMSSPTLDQYHVASRSPEQRRASAVPSRDTAITLPPLQNAGSASPEDARRPAVNAPQVTSTASPSHANASDQMPPSSLAGASALEEGSAGKARDTSGASPSASSTHPPQTTETIQEAPGDSTVAHIKQEAAQTPREASPTDTRRPSLVPSDMEGSMLKSVSSLKHESSMRTGSPLRESSVPMPSTEDASNEASISKKRPAPKKKGTATTKKAPPSKKRKLDSDRSGTPSSRVSKTAFKTGSSKGTPANSSPAPSNRSYSAEPREDDEEEEEEEGTPVSDDLYCICKRPDTGTFMIGCDGTCDDWFHGKCVGIEERDKNLIDKYMCPGCTKAGVGRTTWKRMCRRSGCRQAARIGKNKGGKEGSKYCSDECGVAFFREMTANARGREQAARNRSSRRKGPADIAISTASDLGARGGVLAPGEVKALLNSSKTLDDFKKLGEGVLSPPATPDGKSDNTSSDKADYTEPETQALATIATQKEAARTRHQLLKDRLKFINMAKQAAARAVTEKELKPKDYCGFDPRLEWSEEQFALWRNSGVGKQAFELETLAIDQDDKMEDDDDDELGAVEVCDRKKCARHLEWAKLSTDDVRFEMGDNGDRMRGLDREEREIRERAVLRGRAGGLQGEGSVEVHAPVDEADVVHKGVTSGTAPEIPAEPSGAAAEAMDTGTTATAEAGEAMEVDTAV